MYLILTENVPLNIFGSMYPSIHLQNGFSIKTYPGKEAWDSWESDVSKKNGAKKQTGKT